MAWTIEYAASAQASIKKLDPQSRHRIREYMELRVASLAEPRSSGKALRGPLAGLWRYRVGDHRVICEIQDRRVVVLVVALGNRREIYR